MGRRRSWLRRWLKKLRSTQISRFTLQRRIMLVLGIYLVLVLLVGGWYGVQRLLQPPGYKKGGAGASDLGQLDMLFLEEIMRELASIDTSAGGAGSAAGSGQSGTGGATLPYDYSLLNPLAPGLTPNSLPGPEGAGAGGSPGAGGGQNMGGQGTSGQATVVSEEKLNQMQTRVSTADRLRVLNILRQRLSAEDVRQLVAWARGGITPAEKEAIKQLLAARLTPEELAEFKLLYQKYY